MIQVKLKSGTYDLTVSNHAHLRYQERVLETSCTEEQAAVGLGVMLVGADETWQGHAEYRHWAVGEFHVVGHVEEVHRVITVVTVTPRETLFGFDEPWQRKLAYRALRKVEHGQWD